MNKPKKHRISQKKSTNIHKNNVPSNLSSKWLKYSQDNSFHRVKSVIERLDSRSISNNFQSSSFYRDIINNRSFPYSKVIRGHTGCVNALAISHNKKWLASGGDDRRVLIWDIADTDSRENKSPVSSNTFFGHFSNIFSICWTLKDDQFVSCGLDMNIFLYDFTSNRPIRSFEGHESPVHKISFFANDNHTFMSASDDTTIRLWDTRVQERQGIATLGYPVNGVQCSPVNSYFFITAGKNVSLFDIRNLKFENSMSTENSYFIMQHPRYSFQPLRKYHSGSHREICAANYSPDGSKIVATRTDAFPLVFDTENIEPTHLLYSDKYRNTCTMKSSLFLDECNNLTVCSGSDNFGIFLWDLSTDLEDSVEENNNNNNNEWKKLKTLPDLINVTRPIPARAQLTGHRSIPNSMVFHPPSFRLFSCGVEKTIRMWSPFEMSNDCEYRRNDIPNRQAYNRQECASLLQDLPEDETDGECPRTLAQFDFFNYMADVHDKIKRAKRLRKRDQKRKGPSSRTRLALAREKAACLRDRTTLALGTTNRDYLNLIENDNGYDDSTLNINADSTSEESNDDHFVPGSCHCIFSESDSDDDYDDSNSDDTEFLINFVPGAQYDRDDFTISG